MARVGWDEIGCDGARWDGMGWDGMGGCCGDGAERGDSGASGDDNEGAF